MIVYKVIIQIEKKIEKDWLNWMRVVHIPEIMGLNIFYKSQLFNIIKNKEEEFSSFCIEYYCHSEEEYNIYKKKYSKNYKLNMQKNLKENLMAKD